MKHVALAVAVSLAVAGAASAATPTEGVILAPLAPSSIKAKAVIGQAGGGTRVSFTISGAPRRAPVRAVMNAGTCAKRSASFATAGSATTDAHGRAGWRASILFRNAPVEWPAVGDGSHVLVLVVRGEAVACGAIPGMS